MNLAYIGVGSNIEADKNIQSALQRLSLELMIVAVSSLWHTVAVGDIRPPFLNAVILVETEHDLHSLKEDILCRMEDEMGRVRSSDKNASRPIDLDILIFNHEIQDIQIFVYDHLIYPLAELLPELTNPSSGKTLLEISQEHAASTQAYRVAELKF
jgi:2-amino-4-hydroxy-6-hydroxymethyldihydropteridine diphosphokinase